MAPRTCENFLVLSESGYYQDTIFHRCIKSFMIQVGTPSCLNCYYPRCLILVGRHVGELQWRWPIFRCFTACHGIAGRGPHRYRHRGRVYLREDLQG